MDNKSSDNLLPIVQALNNELTKILGILKIIKIQGHGLEVEILQAYGLHPFDADHPSLIARTMNGFIITVDEFTGRAIDMNESLKEILKNEMITKRPSSST